jgi:hypothetical protein
VQNIRKFKNFAGWKKGVGKGGKMWGKQDRNHEITNSTLFPINYHSLSTLAFFPISLPTKCTNQILEFSLVIEGKFHPHFPTIKSQLIELKIPSKKVPLPS